MQQKTINVTFSVESFNALMALINKTQQPITDAVIQMQQAANAFNEAQKADNVVPMPEPKEKKKG